MLQVSGCSYNITSSDIIYKFEVRIGGQSWEIDKVYKDFQKLHADLTAHYGSSAIPQLTGTVYLRVLSDATGNKRLPKFVDYLTSILSTWKSAFKNPKYLEIPNPRGSKFPPVMIEAIMAQFLEVQENYEMDTSSEEDDEEQDIEETHDVIDESEIHGGENKTKRSSNNNKLGWSDDDNNDDNNKKPSSARAAKSSPSLPNSNATTATATATSANLNNNNDNKKRASTMFGPAQQPKMAPNNNNPAGDDFDIVDEKRDTFQAEKVLNQCRTMTGEVDVIVKDFVIHPSAYIEYNFQVTFVGHSWKVTKRFSQFNEFYNELTSQLKGTEFADYVPPIDDVAFSSWRKCDPDVAETRSIWLTNFFKIIAPMMDDWFDVGWLTHFKIRRRQGEEEDELESYSSNNWIKVAINRLLFDWFNFADHISEFNALNAEKVAKQNEKFLPQFMQKNLENVRKEEDRLQREKNLAYRRSFMEKLSEAEFDDLIRIISSFDDDRHCLGLLEFFVKNGYYYPGKTRVERIQELDSQKAIAEKRRKEAAAVLGMTMEASNNNNNVFEATNSEFNNNNNNNNLEDNNTTTISSSKGWGVLKKKIAEKNQQTSANFNNTTGSHQTPLASSTNFMTMTQQSSLPHENPDAWGGPSNVSAVAFPTSYSTKSSYYQNNNNNQSQQGAADQSMFFRVPSSAANFHHQASSSTRDPYAHHHHHHNHQDDTDDVAMDIFDRMQNSALFGNSTSIKDFATLVNTAVNAAKDQLRGRSKVNLMTNTTTATMNGDGSKNSTSRYDRVVLSRPCGLTSQQMARVADAIPFNDTRAAAIAIMSPILLDMDNLSSIFETLIYDWETAEKTLIELITKKEAPENFKYVTNNNDSS